MSANAWADVEAEEHRGQLRMAERFVRDHGDDLRYVHGIGWHIWDGARWQEDEDDEPSRRVIATVKDALRSAPDLGKTDRDDLMADVRKVESASGIDGVLRITRSLRPVALAHKKLDRDAELFCTPDGVLDLDTGDVRPHDRTDNITKLSGAALGAERSEEWDRFLSRILPDEEVRGFVQRLVGYAMHGEVREHVMPIFTGVGANGKGTLRDAISYAFGDYATECDPELLMASKHPRHGTFLMQLRGRRLVFCSETEKGRRFAEATMKRLVGGDPIEANRMHRDPIVFNPSHTLCMLTNHLPAVSGDDPAVWRRLLVVPFDVTIPAEERDGRLSDRLKAAAPAVLSCTLSASTARMGVALTRGAPMALSRAIPDPATHPTLTAHELARVAGLSSRSVYNACERGDIPNVRIGRRVVIPTADALRRLGLLPSAAVETPAPLVVDPEVAAKLQRYSDAGLRPDFVARTLIADGVPAPGGTWTRDLVERLTPPKMVAQSA